MEIWKMSERNNVKLSKNRLDIIANYSRANYSLFKSKCRFRFLKKTMKLTLGMIILSIFVAVNSVTAGKPKNNDAVKPAAISVYIPKPKSDQVIVEEGGLCNDYYLICNPEVKRKKYLACVYDRHLRGKYCEKVDAPIYYQPNHHPKKDTTPTDPKPKNNGAAKGSGNNVAMQYNQVGGLPGATKANKKA